MIPDLSVKTGGEMAAKLFFAVGFVFLESVVLLSEVGKGFAWTSDRLLVPLIWVPLFCAVGYAATLVLFRFQDDAALQMKQSNAESLNRRDDES